VNLYIIAILWLASFNVYCIGALIKNHEVKRHDIIYTFGPNPLAGAIFIFVFSPLVLVAVPVAWIEDWFKERWERRRDRLDRAAGRITMTKELRAAIRDAGDTVGEDAAMCEISWRVTKVKGDRRRQLREEEDE
jgi:hypothetical protein